MGQLRRRQTHSAQLLNSSTATSSFHTSVLLLLLLLLRRLPLSPSGCIDFVFGLPTSIFVQLHRSHCCFLHPSTTVGGREIIFDSCCAEMWSVSLQPLFHPWATRCPPLPLHRLAMIVQQLVLVLVLVLVRLVPLIPMFNRFPAVGPPDVPSAAFIFSFGLVLFLCTSADCCFLLRLCFRGGVRVGARSLGSSFLMVAPHRFSAVCRCSFWTHSINDFFPLKVLAVCWERKTHPLRLIRSRLDPK